MTTVDMFDRVKPRRKRRVMMHVVDGGVDMIQFECFKCGYNSGWIPNDKSLTENKRGIPCPKCNCSIDSS